MYKQRIQFYVGTGKDKENNPIDKLNSLEWANLQTVMCARFGGFTQQFTEGGWNADDRVMELGMIVTILTDRPTMRRCMAQTGEDLRKVFNQSQVIGTVEEIYTEEYNFSEPTAAKEAA